MDRWVTEGLGDVLGKERNTEVNQAEPKKIQSTVDYLKENELADKHIKDIVLEILEEKRKMEMDSLMERGWNQSTSSDMLDIKETLSRLVRDPDKSTLDIIKKRVSKYLSSDPCVCDTLKRIGDKSYNEIDKKEYDQKIIAEIMSNLSLLKKTIETKENNQR